MSLKRPQRHLLMMLSSAAVAWTLLRLLPWPVALGVVLTVVGMVLLLVAGSWRRWVGRYRVRRHDWLRAIDSYRRFEKLLLTNRFAGLLAPLHLGLYTLDGVARTRNAIAEACVQLKRLDEAEGWLRSALQRDPLYAVPYTNLGTIEALRGQDASARRHFQKAVDLGFSPVLAEQMLRRARQRANRS